MKEILEEIESFSTLPLMIENLAGLIRYPFYRYQRTLNYDILFKHLKRKN
jgi:menaquinone-dependent protoporphyrinogen IX oxidase